MQDAIEDMFGAAQPIPDRHIPTFSDNDTTTLTTNFDTTDILWFSPKVCVRTPYGFAEGYFRHSFDIQEIITWNEGEEEYVDGTWTRAKKISYLPWPLCRTPNTPMPNYFVEFVTKLDELEQYLFVNRSYQPEDSDQDCKLCSFIQPSSVNCHFVLDLEAYEESTEFRWPSIYSHYLRAHGALPSQMLVTIILGRKLSVPDEKYDYDGI